MPQFEYRGFNKSGRAVRSTLEADSVRTARLKLKKDGIMVSDIKNVAKAKAEKKAGAQKASGKVPVRDLAMMTRQLATMLKANVPLVDSLGAVAEQVENPVLSASVSDLKTMVNQGVAFHKALGNYKNIFNKIYISMCEAGEVSGTLDVILLRLAEFTETQDQLQQKVKSALMYPVIMLVMTLLLLVGLFIFVIPKMVAIFEATPELELPWYSVMVIDFSNFLVEDWWIILIVSVLASFLFKAWRSTPEGARKWDAIKLKAPLFGPILRMVAVSRLTRTLATLLNGGVSMLQALDIVRNVVDNHLLAEAVDQARSNITEGESIAGPLKRSGQFPPILIHMVTVGEKTGELENMLIQVADSFDFQVKNKVDGLTSILSPVVIVVMGIAIGVIVFAIMVPMMQMSQMGG